MKFLSRNYDLLLGAIGGGLLANAIIISISPLLTLITAIGLAFANTINLAFVAFALKWR